MILDKEIWKKVNIDFYSDYYEVSTFGRTRSINRTSKTKKFVTKKTKGKILSLNLKRNGYLTILYCADNKRKRFYIHRLIALTFISNPENKKEVNHKDGNKSNNSAFNLEWNTKKENENHASLNNLIAKGEKSVRSKLTENEVVAIRRLHRINPKFNRLQLSKKLGVRDSTIHKIITRQRWKHI